MNNEYAAMAAALIKDIRAKKPLVHHITNYVTVNDCANITLAIGASPIMADAVEEAEEIAAIAQALVLNIGTLNSRTIAAMLAAGKKANALNIPVVLDPVGAGASSLRNGTTHTLLEEIRFSVIRGNMSEIRFIAGLSAVTKGVDASETDMLKGLENGFETAKALAEKLGCVIAITGAKDIISDGKNTVSLENGHPMLGSSVSGTGCMCSSLIGSCCGAGADFFQAAVSALLYMGVAGEIAYAEAGSKGNGSFRVALIDAMSQLNAETILWLAKILEV